MKIVLLGACNRQAIRPWAEVEAQMVHAARQWSKTQTSLVRTHHTFLPTSEGLKQRMAATNVKFSNGLVKTRPKPNLGGGTWNKLFMLQNPQMSLS